MKFLKVNSLPFLVGLLVGYVLFETQFVSNLIAFFPEMFDFKPIGWPDLLDLSILLVIIWYTVDTYNIRKNSKASLRPHLVPALCNKLEICVSNPTNNVAVNVESFYYKESIHKPKNGHDSLEVKGREQFEIGEKISEEDFYSYVESRYKCEKLSKNLRKKWSKITERECVLTIYRDVDSTPYITIRPVVFNGSLGRPIHEQSFSEKL